MKNIHFFFMPVVGMRAPEDILGLSLRDPEGATLSAFGLVPSPHDPEESPLVQSFDLKHGRFRQAAVFWVQAATRDIPRETLKAAIKEALDARRAELAEGEELTKEQEAGVRDAATINLAQHAPIVRKHKRVIALDAGNGLWVLAVEESSQESARRTGHFVARAYDHGTDEDGKAAGPQLRAAVRVARNAVRSVLRDLIADPSVLVDLGRQDVVVGDGCQIKDRDSKTVYSVREGDLGSPEVIALLEPDTREVVKVRLSAIGPCKDPIDGSESLESIADIALHNDAGLKSIKWGPVFRAAGADLAEDPTMDGRVNDFLTASYAAQLFDIWSDLFQVHIEEAL